MFIWSAIAHTALPLGELGIKSLSGEPAVLASLQKETGDKDGLYMFPGPGRSPDPRPPGINPVPEGVHGLSSTGRQP